MPRAPMIDPTRHDIESTVLEDQPWRRGRAAGPGAFRRDGRFVEELTRAGVLLATGGLAAARTSRPPAGTSRSPTGR
jgi:hypothetical protein